MTRILNLGSTKFRGLHASSAFAFCHPNPCRHSLAHADVYNLNFQGILYSRAAPEYVNLNETLDTGDLVPESSPEYNFCVERSVRCFIASGTEAYDTSQPPVKTYALVTEHYLAVYYPGVGDGPDYSDFGPFNIFPEMPNTPFDLFTGTNENPALTTGTFNYSTYGYHYGLSGPVTITDLTTSPVPEPSTLALLGTGALGLAGVFRRRLCA